MTKIRKCAFCTGTGKDPFDLLSFKAYCLTCDGSGFVEVEEPFKVCVFCNGTGKNPLGARVPCIVCGGKGVNHTKSDTNCKLCNGTGKSSDGLPCTRCGGKGFNGLKVEGFRV